MPAYTESSEPFSDYAVNDICIYSMKREKEPVIKIHTSLLRENSFDKVFLATEDVQIFHLFMESDICNEILYVLQELDFPGLSDLISVMKSA